MIFSYIQFCVKEFITVQLQLSNLFVENEEALQSVVNSK